MPCFSPNTSASRYQKDASATTRPTRRCAVAVDDAARDRLRQAIARARELSRSLQRPPVADNENLCAKCSLAPVCLPEESRLAAAMGADEPEQQEDALGVPKARRLFPKHDARRTLHVVDRDARVKRSGLQFVVRTAQGEDRKYPGMDVGAVVLHGSAQITSQAVHFAAANDIAVHWISGGGAYVGGMAPPAGVQRRLRQYRALEDGALRLHLARRVAQGQAGESGTVHRPPPPAHAASGARRRRCSKPCGCRFHRWSAAVMRTHCAATKASPRAATSLRSPCCSTPTSGTWHSPGAAGARRATDSTPALSFGYGLLYREVMAAIIAVGLDSTLGFFHTPRTAAHPLALDLMELFRTTLWDMPLVASVNRRQWSGDHLQASRDKVWLSDQGKKLAISLFEQRKQESWKHPVLSYSLSYARSIEMEARLLEKEWSGEEGLFARMRLRG